MASWRHSTKFKNAGRDAGATNTNPYAFFRFLLFATTMPLSTCGAGVIFQALPTGRPTLPKGATMALTFSLIDTWDDGKRIHVSGTIAASGNYSTGGDTIDLSQSPLVASAQPPINGTAWMDGLAGYDYVFIPGAAMNSNKVKIFQQGAAAGAFPELAAGAYPGAITADSITFYGIFKKLQ
jgi:hypothetical protein